MAITLVTGAPGWLGLRLTRILAQGLLDDPRFAIPDTSRRIRCLVYQAGSKEVLETIASNIECVPSDLRNRDQVAAFCDGADGGTLFHCAGVIHPSRRVREFFEINVEGTRNLLEAAAAAGVRRAIVVSSNSPLGTNPNPNHRFDEQSPYQPYMNYGRSKMLMEQVAQEIGAKGKLEIVIIRPPWFYGVDQPPRQTLFFQMIRKGTVPLVGNGENRRSMAYVDNICQGLLLCEAVQRAAGQTYWIADRRPYTMNEIIETIEQLLETEFDIPVAHRRVRLPNIVGEIATLADAAIQAAGLYQQKLHVLSEMNKTIACTIEKAERELGYTPHVALEEGMRRSIRWCIEQGIQI